MKRIHGIRCTGCKKRMFSFHRHDFKFCGCENETFIDGGTDYIRFGFKKLKPTGIYWSKQDGKYPVVKVKDRFPY